MTCSIRTLAGRRDLLAPAAAFPERYPALLESVTRSSAHARYDILFAFPQSTLMLASDGLVHEPDGRVHQGRFLDALDSAWRAERLPPDADDGLPFHGGWVILLAYELAAEIEPTLHLQRSDIVPVALALRCPAAIIVDHLHERTILLAEAGQDALLDTMAADLAIMPTVDPLTIPASIEEDAPAHFLDGVARIHEHLHAGDVFQANLSRAWRARFDCAPSAASLYAALRRANPAPFAGLLQQQAWAVISSSPERLVEVRRGVAQTLPIAGTRPRLAGDD